MLTVAAMQPFPHRALFAVIGVKECNSSVIL